MLRPLRQFIAFLLVAVLTSPMAFAADQDQVNDLEIPETNAYGPTVTNPATLTNVGIPEYEFFGTWSKQQDGSTSRIAPVLIKYTWAPRWMAYGFSNTFSSESGGGVTSRGFGDPTFGIKYLIAPPYPKKAAQAVSLQYKVPTSNPFSTGLSDYTLTYYYTRWLGKCELDVNVWGSSLGIPGDTRRYQFNQSASLEFPITKRLAYTAEIYRFGNAGPTVPTIVSTLHAINFDVGPALNVSFAVDFGLNQNAPVRSFILGAVFYLGNPKPRANTLSQPEPENWPLPKKPEAPPSP